MLHLRGALIWGAFPGGMFVPLPASVAVTLGTAVVAVAAVVALAVIAVFTFGLLKGQAPKLRWGSFVFEFRPIRNDDRDGGRS